MIELMENNETEDQTMVLQLPNELLLRIIKLIPMRFELASVCGKFYEIVCKIEAKKFRISLTEEKVSSEPSPIATYS